MPLGFDQHVNRRKFHFRLHFPCFCQWEGEVLVGHTNSVRPRMHIAKAFPGSVKIVESNCLCCLRFFLFPMLRRCHNSFSSPDLPGISAPSPPSPPSPPPPILHLPLPGTPVKQPANGAPKHSKTVADVLLDQVKSDVPSITIEYKGIQVKNAVIVNLDDNTVTDRAIHSKLRLPARLTLK